MGKLRPLLLVVAIAAVGSFWVALAQGASPPAPIVTTQAATSIGLTGAVVHGTINPEGQPTDYAFQWGPTAGYGHETTLASAGSSTSTAAISAGLTGLAPGTKYHFRAIAIISTGAVTVGVDKTFVTTGTAPAPSAPPAVSTQSATQLAQSSMTLNGLVDPKGKPTAYYFEYGTTTKYGYETASADAGAGNNDVKATAQLTGLAANTTYHFRLVAVSAGGTALGADRTATTPPPPPAVVTSGASKVDMSSALVTAQVNPEGEATTYYFQFGTTTAYGVQTPPASLGSGTSNIAVQGDLEGLIPNTGYHYRIVAQSKGGTSFGADRVVKTARQTQIRSTLRVLGRMAFVSRGGWLGVAMGCFGGQARCKGRVRLMHGARVIGTHRFGIPPANGALEVIRLNRFGRSLFGHRYHGPVAVEVKATTTAGQHLSRSIKVARWF
jgi:phosphodiesterase/alkaline phosphatase D-like protein